eukprot:comp20236_c0_seq2/m.25241 comp20236_c0_seq2/g.25241  ORF comp20236_c0_seq2/g.25241 comp20236_c0_seq2/m.25241 type:complete len:423 (-) comp20236_c0_seq2:374-1642(-)
MALKGMLKAWLHLGLLCLSSVSAKQEKEKGPSVATPVSAKSLKTTIAENDDTVVLFYAPFCTRCNKILPRFESAAKALKKAGDPAKLVQVDVMKHQPVFTDYNVGLLPVIRYYKGGKSVGVYDGPDKAKGIVRFVKAGGVTPEEDVTSHSVDISQEEIANYMLTWGQLPVPEGRTDIIKFKDAKEHSKGLKEHPLLMVKYYTEWCGVCKSIKLQYINAGHLLRDKNSGARLAEVDCEANQEICRKANVQSYPTINIYRNGTLFEVYNRARTDVDIAHYFNVLEARILKGERLTKAFNDEEEQMEMGSGFKAAEDQAYYDPATENENENTGVLDGGDSDMDLEGLPEDIRAVLEESEMIRKMQKEKEKEREGEKEKEKETEKKEDSEKEKEKEKEKVEEKEEEKEEEEGKHEKDVHEVHRDEL